MIFSTAKSSKLFVVNRAEQLLTLLVGLADTMMVSYAGEAAVSGVSLVNQLNTGDGTATPATPACSTKMPASMWAGRTGRAA